MTIGIIGSGLLGSGIARALARKSIPALISNSRGPESLRELTDMLGKAIQPATVAEAAREDIVIVGVPWAHLQAALGGIRHWGGRIVIDATNPVLFLEPDSPEAKDPGNPLGFLSLKAVDLGGRVSSEVFAEFVPGARVVKAFNHLEPVVLADPEVAGGRRVMFYSGYDAAAKIEVGKLIDRLGLFGIDLGSLAVGGQLTQLPGGPLPALNLIKV
jgi:8-hydroxy-5-deazaflavin:NADPH oxidoreductase